MIDDEMRAEFKKIDDRLTRVEQFLPSVATKDDLKNFATKDDLKNFATKDDLKNFATKDDLKALRGDMLAGEERTRRHFDVIAESLRDEIRLGLEGNLAGSSRIESLEVRHERLERRVTALETPPRRKK